LEFSVKNPECKKDLKDALLTSCKIGAEIMLGSEDPFQSMINVLGKSCIGTSLSKLSCSQVAGIMGLVVTTFAPQVLSILIHFLLTSFVYKADCTSGVEENH
jgi:hypothetical protein